MGIIGSNYGAGTPMMLADPDDIAAVAAEELTNLTFTGKSIRYIASDERTADEIAKTLGNAIGKPDLNCVEFRDADSLSAMQQDGLPEDVARNYVEMGTALRSGEMAKEYNAANLFRFKKPNWKLLLRNLPAHIRKHNRSNIKLSQQPWIEWALRQSLPLN